LFDLKAQRDSLLGKRGLTVQPQKDLSVLNRKIIDSRFREALEV